MFIDESLKGEIQNQLSALKKKVKIVYFTQELECQFCRETRELLEELSALSEKIEMEVYSFVNDKEKTEEYKIENIPATVLLDEDGNDYGIRYYGIPSGYEFSSLMEDVKMLGTGETGLPANIIEDIKKVDRPVHLQVFVTPTCPYCPQAVTTAHAFAFINENIKADMVEATEFPHLAQKYNVRGVPRTIINDDDYLEGAAPDQTVLEKINESLKKISANNENN